MSVIFMIESCVSSEFVKFSVCLSSDVVESKVALSFDSSFELDHASLDFVAFFNQCVSTRCEFLVGHRAENLGFVVISL